MGALAYLAQKELVLDENRGGIREKHGEIVVKPAEKSV
jgi:hypothetical protein